jgi:hypothetical protein
MYLSGEYSKAHITTLFETSYTSLDRWINRYGPAYLTTPCEDLCLSLEEELMTNQESSKLLDRIKELEKRLELSQMKSELLDTMIDIAEEELHIPIRKKYGPQQSKEKRKNTK